MSNFLALGLSLTLEEINLAAEVADMGLKMFFHQILNLQVAVWSWSMVLLSWL